MGAADKAPRRQSKTVHEAFTRFFEHPSRETLRALLFEHVGELRECDFKESWPNNASVAKHVLGLANSNGGCLIVGVKENDDKTLTPIGLSEIQDKADIFNGVKPYVPQIVLDALEVGDFAYDAPEYPILLGKRFQVVFVSGRPDAVPFVAEKGGDGVRASAVYVRREGSTNEASYEDIQRLIAQRVAATPQTAQARDLKSHLEEVKVLYGEIPRTISASLPAFVSIAESMSRFLGEGRPNPSYPKEDYTAFVLRLLSAKKLLIEDLLGFRREG